MLGDFGSYLESDLLENRDYIIYTRFLESNLFKGYTEMDSEIDLGIHYRSWNRIKPRKSLKK